MHSAKFLGEELCDLVVNETPAEFGTPQSMVSDLESPLRLRSGLADVGLRTDGPSARTLHVESSHMSERRYGQTHPDVKSITHLA